MGAEFINEAPGTETDSIRSRLKSKHEGFQLVWIRCPFPVIAQGLKELLGEETQVHVGHEPPEDGTPSSIVFCLHSNEEDVTSEVERLRKISPHTPIIAFSPSRIDLQTGKAAFRAGVSGFIHAEMQPHQMISVISLASIGEVVIPGELLRSLLVEEETLMGTAALTSRQREILSLVAQGLTNAQVAERLSLSEFTIKQHLYHAYKVLKVRNRTEAAKLWSNFEGSANSSSD